MAYTGRTHRFFPSPQVASVRQRFEPTVTPPSRAISRGCYRYANHRAAWSLYTFTYMYSNIYIIRELYTRWSSVYKSHNNKQLALVMLCRKWRTNLRPKNPWRTNPWRTNPWRTNSSPNNPRVTNKIPWRMARYGIHSLRNIEILGKKKRV